MKHNSGRGIMGKAAYAWRVGAKWFSFFVFGLGTVILVFIVFPVMRLFIHPRKKFKKYGHRVISGTFRFFIALMNFVGAACIRVKDRAAFAKLERKIIIANHPSLLDVVMLISLIPNADCIVNAALLRNIVRGVVKQLYIPNSLDFDELVRVCRASLEEGNCLIIFPEGTRTPRSAPIIVKKGAARMAWLSGVPLVPVFLGGNDKWGLGKKDPWWAVNSKEKYIYEVTMLDEIDPKKYANLSYTIAAKRLTDEIKDTLFPPPLRERVL